MCTWAYERFCIFVGKLKTDMFATGSEFWEILCNSRVYLSKQLPNALAWLPNTYIGCMQAYMEKKL